MSFNAETPLKRIASCTLLIISLGVAHGQGNIAGKYQPGAGDDPNTVLRIELEKLSWQGSDVGSTNYADFEGTVQVAIVTSDGDIINSQTLKAFNGQGIAPGSEVFGVDQKITYYCAMGNVKATGKVVLWGSIVEKDDGPNPGFGKDSDDKLTGNCSQSDGPSIRITALSAGQSQTLSRTWSGTNDNSGMGPGVSTAFRIDAQVKVKRVSFSDVPSSKRATVGCADAAAGFLIRQQDASNVLVECDGDFSGEYASLCGKFKGSYTGSESNGFSKGSLWVVKIGDGVKFVDQSTGKQYYFDRSGGGGPVDIFASAGGGAGAAQGDWYWPDEPVQSLKVSEGTPPYPLTVWINGKPGDFEADGTSASGQPIYKQAVGSVRIQVGKDNITLLQGSSKTKLYRTPPGAGQKRSGPSQAGAGLFGFVRDGNMEAVEEVVSEGTDVNMKNAAGRTVLHEAVSSDNTAMTEFLIRTGADVNARTNDGKSAMDMAIAKNNTAMVEMLMENNANYEDAMLTSAIMTNKEDMIRIFLDKGKTRPEIVMALAEEKGKYEIFTSMIEQQGAVPTNSLFERSVTARRIQFADYMLDNPAIDKDEALRVSIGNGNKPLIEKCLMKGAAAGPALTYAISKNDLALATSSIEQYSADASTSLPLAVGKGSIPMVTLLLDKGADASSGLKAAVDTLSLPMVNLLLERGADNTAEMANAAGRGGDAIVQAMISKGGDANAGMAAAVKADKASTVKILVEAGADPAPAMAYAVDKSNGPLLELLISKGGDATVSAYVAKAAERGDVAILNILLEKGSADANPGMLPAVTHQGAGVVDILLKHGASGSSPALIKKSVERGEVTTAGLLLNSGADASPGDLIRVAVSQKNTAMTGLLLEKGADANNGTMESIKQNSTEILSLLKSKGADLGRAGYLAASAPHNNTTLSGMLLEGGCAPQEGVVPAANSNASKVLDLLLAKGADLKDVKLIVTAVTNGYDQVATVLVKGGCDPTGFVDPGSGGNLLHVATAQENFPMVQVLIGAKVDVNMKASGSGDTPLHVAARGGKDNLDCVMALVGAGSDVNATNSRGKSVIQEAKGPKIRKFLKSEGGERRPDK